MIETMASKLRGVKTYKRYSLLIRFHRHGNRRWENKMKNNNCLLTDFTKTTFVDNFSDNSS
jgi:hypothetical protein